MVCGIAVALLSHLAFDDYGTDRQRGEHERPARYMQQVSS
jgi:hypothetical protein